MIIDLRVQVLEVSTNHTLCLKLAEKAWILAMEEVWVREAVTVCVLYVHMSYEDYCTSTFHL